MTPNSWNRHRESLATKKCFHYLNDVLKTFIKVLKRIKTRHLFQHIFLKFCGKARTGYILYLYFEITKYYTSYTIIVLYIYIIMIDTRV